MWSGGVGNRFQAAAIAVTEGGTTTYDTTLTTSGRLAGTVTVAPGAPGPNWRLTAHNAVTGDPIGVIDGEGDVAYEMRLPGGQQVTVGWEIYGDGWKQGVHAGGAKVGIPANGTKRLNLTIG